MFTKYFAKFESWLRGIIRDEVSRVDTSLQREREALQTHLRVFDEQTSTFNKALDRILESSYFVENAQLREHIKTLGGSIAECRSLADRVAHPEKYYHERHQQV